MSPVFVTGCGVACGLGYDPLSLWRALCDGSSSIAALDIDAGYRSRIGSCVDSTKLVLPSGLGSFTEPSVRYALHAAASAIEEACLSERGVDPTRVGVIISTGVGGLSVIEAQYDILKERGPSRVSPYFVPNAIHNASAGLISMLYGYKGPTTSVSSACSSSTQAIGLALRLLQAGDIDVCIVGGTEHATTPLGMAGFSAQRALSQRNDAPKEACRPWDKARDGFVMGDGSAVLVLENAHSMKERPPMVYGEIVDIGWSSDAYHAVQPDPSGGGAILSMRRAMKTLEDISVVDYINAHATGTPLGDLIEPMVMRDLWPKHYASMCMSSTKSMHGHLLGAAGALEALITLLALKHQVVPPTINCPNPDVTDIDLVTQGAKAHTMRYALSNSFGFGGTNATLLCKAV